MSGRQSLDDEPLEPDPLEPDPLDAPAPAVDDVDDVDDDDEELSDLLLADSFEPDESDVPPDSPSDDFFDVAFLDARLSVL